MKLRFPWVMLMAVGLAFFLCPGGCNTDETDNPTRDAPPEVNVTGSWTGTFTTASSEGDFNFTMTMDTDGEVEGMNTRLGRFTGDVTGNRFTIDSTDFFATVTRDSRTMNGTFTDSESGDVATVVCTKD